jgi:nucleotide-binding universal stress UspA family protein
MEDVMKVDRVLVPLDGSPLAERAIPKALELLSDDGASTLILLRAVKATTLPGSDPTEAQVAVVHEAESYLATVAARLREQGITRLVTSVCYGSAAKAIVDAARVRLVDLIVMSTHGRSGLSRVMHGSVAESVLRRTRTPILLVSAAGSAWRCYRKRWRRAPNVTRGTRRDDLPETFGRTAATVTQLP